MKKFIIINVIVLIIVNSVRSQPNLVPNPSFEDYFNLISPPSSDYLQDYIFNWYWGFGYFHINRPGIYYGVPSNEGGYQYPRTGSGYCGIFTYAKNSYPIRQYIQTQLTDTLKQGKKYKVSFYVSLADTMNANNNSIGAFFASDSTLVYNTGGGVFSITPQIKNQESNDLSSKINWTLVADTLIATGNEKWITIGNFLTDSLSSITALDSNCSLPFSVNCGAYYYIDDVSVTLIDETGIDELKKNEFSLFPNPNNGSFKLQYNGVIYKQMQFYITNVYGKLIDTKEILNTTTDYENTSLTNGLYFYSLRSNNEELQRGKFVVVK